MDHWMRIVSSLSNQTEVTNNTRIFCSDILCSVWIWLIMQHICIVFAM